MAALAVRAAKVGAGFAQRLTNGVFNCADVDVPRTGHEQITIGQRGFPADVESENVFADFFIGRARGDPRKFECVYCAHIAPICLFLSRRRRASSSSRWNIDAMAGDNTAATVSIIWRSPGSNPLLTPLT